MTIILCLNSSCLSPFSHSTTTTAPPLPFSKLSHPIFSFLLASSCPPSSYSLKHLTSSHCYCFRTRASISENGVFLSNKLIGEVSGVKDADEALRIISESCERKNGSGVVSVSECCDIIKATLERGNVELALSVFYAMRSSFDQGGSEEVNYVERYRWSRPDVRVYALLVQGLAASLRVSDALRIIDNICQVGVSPGPFWEGCKMSCLYGSCCCCTTSGRLTDCLLC